MKQKFKAERPFGVFTNDKGEDIIIYVIEGAFASDAWLRGERFIPSLVRNFSLSLAMTQRDIIYGKEM